MRLRYLHLEGVSPLTDLRITFGHEPVLGRKVAIRFVVGVNGSGKTRFLQALADIFLHLERPTFPPFPVTLAYDLGADDEARTIYLRHHPGETRTSAFIEFARSLAINSQQEWEELPELLQPDGAEPYPVRGVPYLQGKLPGSGAISASLPSALLVYTSGATTRWQEIFHPEVMPDEFSPDDDSPEVERPSQWSMADEHLYQSESGGGADSLERAGDEAGATRATSIGQFVHPEALKLVVCAVTLEQAVKDFKAIRMEGEADFLTSSKREKTGLRAILNAVDWLYPVTVSMRLRLEHNRLTKAQSGRLARLFDCATTVLRDPAEQPGRLVVFDLQRPLPDRDAVDTSTVAALIESLAYEDTEDAIEPFTIFRTLQSWRDAGLLTDVNLTVRKRNLEDLLLYDWLSDGEKVFLGRMALLHLFKKQADAMIILDEPETHFNDYWKRQIVDIIDDNLRDVASEVVISTHSSIALTDVFDTEITLLKKQPNDGSISVVRQLPLQTFGALPSEIMLQIFDAPDVVGQRANEFLDMALKVSSHPKQVEAIWGMMNGSDGSKTANAEYERIKGHKDFRRLWALVGPLHDYGSDERLYHTLVALKRYTQRATETDRVTVVAALRALTNKLGPGYYQFEFSRRIDILEKNRAS